MVSLAHEGQRVLISGADILTEAQLSTFNNPNLPAVVPEPGALALLIGGGVGGGLFVLRRRLRLRV